VRDQRLVDADEPGRVRLSVRRATARWDCLRSRLLRAYWRYFQFPDLAYLRPDESPFLTSIAHDRLACFEIDNGELRGLRENVHALTLTEE